MGFILSSSSFAREREQDIPGLRKRHAERRIERPEHRSELTEYTSMTSL